MAHERRPRKLGEAGGLDSSSALPDRLGNMTGPNERALNFYETA